MFNNYSSRNYELLINGIISLRFLVYSLILLTYINVNIAKQSIVNNNDYLISTYSCINGEIPLLSKNTGNEVDLKYEKKNCIFKNVCIASNKDNNFKFFYEYPFANSDHKNFINYIHLFKDPSDDIELLITGEENFLSTSNVYYHKLAIYNNFIPIGSRIITHRVVFVEAFESWRSDNIGHLLIDVFASAFVSQLNLGLNISKDFQLLSLNGILKGYNYFNLKILIQIIFYD